VKNAEALQSLYRHCKKLWKGAKNKLDFSLVLKVCREFDDVTGKHHMLAELVNKG